MNAEVVVLGPRGLHWSFKTTTPSAPQDHMHKFSSLCVHREWSNDVMGFIKCENVVDHDGPTGFLCAQHQYVAQPSILNRRSLHNEYMRGRDFEQELIDSIVLHEQRMIARAPFVRVARGLRVEVGRTLKELPYQVYDGIWEDVELESPVHRQEYETDINSLI